MKFIKKVDDSFVLKNLLNDHLSKFSVKNELELTFLDDIRTFVERKSQLELQHSLSLTKLCQQFMNKKEYQINNAETASNIYIPDKWKTLLEEYAYVAEKKQASSKSLLMHCEYFKNVKEIKAHLNQTAINNLKKLHTVLMESSLNCSNAYKLYCFENFLHDQLDEKTKIKNMGLLEKKLKKKNINVTQFKKAYEKANKSLNNDIINERKRKLDFAKLNYATANCCLNQQLQYYFSMEIPQLLHLQNGPIDQFVEECINQLIFRELDDNKFLIRHFEDSFMTSASIINSNAENKSNAICTNMEENKSEDYFIKTQDCFNNLIQYDLQPHDTDLNKDFTYTFEKKYLNYLSNDYIKLSAKLNDLEELMKTMLTQINNKRVKMEQPDSNFECGGNTNNYVGNLDDCKSDFKLEQDRFSIAEKKMQMIQLQSKLDVLSDFNISLEELNQYHSAAEFARTRVEFDTDLHQNLELWDNLMKSIDEMTIYSNGSYDVEIERKNSNDFIETSLSSGDSSIGSFVLKTYQKSQEESVHKIEIDPKIEPRYAKTISNVESDPSSNFLSFTAEQSLIIFDKFNDNSYKAIDNLGRTGYVLEKNFEFYPDEPVFVRSVYVYDGLDEQELSFPADVYIRLLRKNLPKKKIDDEIWYEGVYENKIGYFPSIFVEDVSFNKFKEIQNPKSLSTDSDKIDEKLEINNLEPCSYVLQSPDNQKVPQ